MTKPKDLMPAGCDSEIDCDRCQERMVWLTFGAALKSTGVCGCPWTLWEREEVHGTVFRSVPHGCESYERAER